MRFIVNLVVYCRYIGQNVRLRPRGTASDARSNRPVTQWADPVGFTWENEGDFDRCTRDKVELILSRGPVGYIRFGFNELEIALGVDPEELHMECIDEVRTVLVSSVAVD